MRFAKPGGRTAQGVSLYRHAFEGGRGLLSRWMERFHPDYHTRPIWHRVENRLATVLQRVLGKMISTWDVSVGTYATFPVSSPVGSEDASGESTTRILYLEPFDGGSHAAFTRTLQAGVKAEWTALTLPGRHWKWRARGAAVFFVREHWDILQKEYDLCGLAHFSTWPIYSHSVRAFIGCPGSFIFTRINWHIQTSLSCAPGDNHYGFSQMVSCLAATHCVFNSQWNLTSFWMRLPSSCDVSRSKPPGGWRLSGRASVLPVRSTSHPEDGSRLSQRLSHARKGPSSFGTIVGSMTRRPTSFDTLFRLNDEGVPFRLAVCGERYRSAPECFERAEQVLAKRVIREAF